MPRFQSALTRRLRLGALGQDMIDPFALDPGALDFLPTDPTAFDPFTGGDGILDPTIFDPFGVGTPAGNGAPVDIASIFPADIPVDTIQFDFGAAPLDTSTGIFEQYGTDVADAWGGTYDATTGMIDFGGLDAVIDWDTGNVVFIDSNGFPQIVLDPATGQYLDPAALGYSDISPMATAAAFQTPQATQAQVRQNRQAAASGGGAGAGAGSAKPPASLPQQQKPLTTAYPPTLQSKALARSSFSPTVLLIGGAVLLGALFLARKK